MSDDDLCPHCGATRGVCGCNAKRPMPTGDELFGKAPDWLGGQSVDDYIREIRGGTAEEKTGWNDGYDAAVKEYEPMLREWEDDTDDAIRKLGVLHTEAGGVCTHCHTSNGIARSWPCPTINIAWHVSLVDPEWDNDDE